MARKVLEELYGVVRTGDAVHARDVRAALRIATQQPDVELGEVYEDVLGDVGSRRRIAAKNLAQRRYVELMRKHDVVFAIGPAGTGKTYLAMAMAIAALNRQKSSRMVLDAAGRRSRREARLPARRWRRRSIRTCARSTTRSTT